MTPTTSAVEFIPTPKQYDRMVHRLDAFRRTARKQRKEIKELQSVLRAFGMPIPRVFGD